MESDLIQQEQETKNKKQKSLDMSTEVKGSSFLYMFIFYLVTSLVVCSMIFQFISLRGLWIKPPTVAVTEIATISVELIYDINLAIPYDNLVLALILYGLGMFGLEGTRAVIMSFDIEHISEKAKNMPAYKRNRLIQILITFAIITIAAIILQMICIKHGVSKADFRLNYLTTGIATFMALLAYSDFGPKVSKQISNLITPKNETTDETETVSEGN